jgi:hypothetical protein
MGIKDYCPDNGLHALTDTELLEGRYNSSIFHITSVLAGPSWAVHLFSTLGETPSTQHVAMQDTGLRLAMEEHEGYI